MLFPPNPDSIDIADSGNLEAEATAEVISEATAEVISEAIAAATAKTKMVTIGLFLFELMRPW